MTDYEDLQHRAARRFLQTALVVDDRASTADPHATKTVEPDPGEIVGPRGPSVGGRAQTSEKAAGEAPRNDDEREAATNEAPAAEAQADNDARAAAEAEANVVHVKEMADRFADLELTCGVLKPSQGQAPDEVTERIARAARGVDIVVLDWMLDEKSGFTAEEAVKRVVAQDRYGRRLLAIYTTQRDLGAISDKLAAAIEQAKQVEGDDLALDVGGTRIVIFHKGGPDLPEDYKRYARPEDVLPGELVGIFVELSAGLVPAIALNALAATRENTHRLLRRLGSGLDLGYMGHLLRLEYREDGEQHLLDAVSGELRAVIEDDDSTRTMASDGFDAWLSHHDDQLRASADALKGIGAAVADHDEWAQWKKDHKAEGLGKLSEEDVTELLVPEDEAAAARRSDARFAQLMAMRRPYARPRPGLHLGTIVREREHPDHYWLCIQPLCDSVRLDADRPTKFLMLPLEAVDHASKKANANFVVDGPDGEPLHLWSWDSSSDLEIMRLRPNHNDAVHFEPAADDTDGAAGRTASTEEGLTLVWVAQLKPAHAARVAHEYGTKLSRVGLDESEWMRMRGRRGNQPDRAPRIPVADRGQPAVGALGAGQTAKTASADGHVRDAPDGRADEPAPDAG
jgi:hypothetical protein